MAKQIAIIGAGASGLVALKSCLEENLQPVCFEKDTEIGGLWHYTEEIKKNQGCVSKGTIINCSKEMWAISDFPVQADYPNFMHNTKVFKYFKSYAQHFGLEKYIKFNTEILNVEKADDYITTGKWKLKIKHADKDEATSEIYDAVMLCTGQLAEKDHPHFEGDDIFKGTMIHTHEYKNYHRFEDKRVVVIGAGNSGTDVAVELSRIAKQVYLCVRNGVWVTSRTSKNGLPRDLEKSRFALTKKYLAGTYYMNRKYENQMNSRFDHSLYGMKPTYRFLQQVQTTSDDLPNRIAIGAIIVKPGITRFQETGVELVDGSVLEDIDAIIYATGYKLQFSFLDEKILDLQQNKVNLYKLTFPPDLEHPTLAVIGCIQPRGSNTPVFELQSRWATRVFKGLIQQPSSSEMWSDIKEKQDDKSRRYVKCLRQMIQVDWIEFMDELADLIGCKPNIGKMLLRDPILAMKVYFGPCTPYQYRLQGPGKWDGAREAIMTTMDRVHKPFKTKGTVEEYENSNTCFKMLYYVIVGIFVVIMKIVLF